MDNVENRIDPTTILNSIKKKNLVKRITLLLIALFVSALLFNLILLPMDLVTGGVGGIAVIFNYIYDFDASIVIFIISIILLLFSFLYLGVEKSLASVLATFAYPFFVNITSNIINYIYIDSSDMLLLAVIAGLVSGISNGIMYKTGFSSGGTSIISQILYKYFRISMGNSSLVVNGIIVIAGGFTFGWTKVMYALIILFINSQMIDRVILGVSKNKAFYIITSEYNEISDFIIKKLNHSVTIFDVKGGFLEKKRKVLLTVIPSREYFQLTEGIKIIDSQAFFLASDAYQVEGGK